MCFGYCSWSVISFIGWKCERHGRWWILIMMMVCCLRWEFIGFGLNMNDVSFPKWVVRFGVEFRLAMKMVKDIEFIPRGWLADVKVSALLLIFAEVKRTLVRILIMMDHMVDYIGKVSGGGSSFMMARMVMRMRLHWWLWQYVSEVTWVKLFKIIGILKFRLVVFMLKILEILEKDPWCWLGRAYHI